MKEKLNFFEDSFLRNAFEGNIQKIAISKDEAFEKYEKEKIQKKEFGRILPEGEEDSTSRRIFDEIVAADPSPQNQGDQYGVFAKKLVDMYANNGFQLEDLSNATEYIKFILEHMNEVDTKAIRAANTLGDIYEAIEPIMKKHILQEGGVLPDKQAEYNEGKNQIKTVYDTNEWRVDEISGFLGAMVAIDNEYFYTDIPKEMKSLSERRGKWANVDASGRSARWCTGYDIKYYNNYTYDGEIPLYNIFHKPTDQRWQFDPRSDEFRNRGDNMDTRGFIETIKKTKSQDFLEFLKPKISHLTEFWKDVDFGFDDYFNALTKKPNLIEKLPSDMKTQIEQHLREKLLGK